MNALAAPQRKFKAVIGRAEMIDFPELGIEKVYAKVDTGAHRSSLDCSYVREKDGVLEYTPLHKNNKSYRGERRTTKQYKLVEVENSFGHREERFEVKLKVKIGHRTVKTSFTLANRGRKTYPVLLGRKLLKDRFLVDVNEGSPHPSDEES